MLVKRTPLFQTSIDKLKNSLHTALTLDMKERTEIVTLVAVSVISLLLFYLPFALNIDAVLGVYVVVSKTFYTPASPLYSAYFLAASYFATHLPGYPIIIWFFWLSLSPFCSDARRESCDLSSCSRCFLSLHSEVQARPRYFFPPRSYSFFPPRWFLYRSIGASEPLFILLTLLMLYFMKKDEATKATLLGACATPTRIWGIITFPVLIGVWLWNKKLTTRRFALALAIPASLLLLFSFHAYSLGNFFAYFAVNQALMGPLCW